MKVMMLLWMVLLLNCGEVEVKGNRYQHEVLFEMNVLWGVYGSSS